MLVVGGPNAAERAPEVAQAHDLVVANDEQLYKVISEDLQAITEIDSTETWTVMRIEKSNFSWATQLFRTVAEQDASSSPAEKQ